MKSVYYLHRISSYSLTHWLSYVSYWGRDNNLFEWYIPYDITFHLFVNNLFILLIFYDYTHSLLKVDY